MDKVRKLWIPVLLGVLLIAVVVGVAGAGRNNRPHEALGPTAYITVPAAAFHSRHQSAEWVNTGQYISNTGFNDDSFLAGPIAFPHAGAVRVTGFALVATDNQTYPDVCAWLKKTSFSSGASESMAHVCTSGSDPSTRRFYTKGINPNYVNPQYAACWVELFWDGPESIRVHAVRIAYRPFL